MNEQSEFANAAGGFLLHRGKLVHINYCNSRPNLKVYSLKIKLTFN